MAAPPGRPRRRGGAALKACLWVCYHQGRCFFLTEGIGRAPSRCCELAEAMCAFGVVSS